MDAVAWGRPAEKLNEGNDQTHPNDQTHSSEDDDDFVTVVRKRHSQSNAVLSQKFRNGGMTDFSGRGKEFQTNQRQERRRNFRDRERHKFPSEGRERDGRPGGDRNRNHNKYQHNAVPSQQQPPTSHTQKTISSGSSNNSTNSNNQSSYDRRRSGVTNGSICSESGSSSFGTTESFVNSNNSNGLLDLDPPHQIVNQIEPPSVENHHVRHLSGDSVSGSASVSVSEADNMHAEIAQSSEESTEPQYVIAPVPAVNPWRINPNAASILSKKAPLVAQKPSTNVAGRSLAIPAVESVAVKPHTLSTPKIEKKSATISKRTDKDKTNSNTVKNSTISQPGEQSLKVASNKSTMTQVDNSKETTKPSQQLTDVVGQDAFTPTRRAFAAVTRNQKIGFESPKVPVARASPKDWPSLQETVIIPGANSTTPTAVQSKPVISGADKSGRNFPLKNENHSSGESSLTDSDDSTIYNQVQKDGLPSDKWPSISDAAVTEDAKISNAYLKQNGATDIDKIASQILISEAVDHLTLKDSGIESEPRFTENGSFSSSDDNEPSAADNELDIEAGYEKGKKGKKLKQKWVPLSLPETPSAKSRMRKARNEQSIEREKVEKEVRTKEKVYLHKGSDKPALNDGRVNQTYSPRGRGRASGVRGRNNNRGRIVSQHWNYGETVDGVMISPGEEYPDYPPDYTTLPAMYPVSEFIMPYDYYGSYSPSIGTGTDDTQTAVPTTYVPVDDAVVSDMVKTQIEYYFSEENLEKDFYLRRKMDNEGYLPITFIATFPRVKTMTLDYNVVLQAIQSSPELELKADLSCVRTKHDPTKWPILDETTVGLPLPPILPQNSATLMAYNTSNGYISLSVTASPAPLTSFTIGEKLNPNVPEFVPKLKVVESS